MSDHSPRLDKDDNVFTEHEELPDAYIISVDDTFSAHHTRTHHKASCKMSRFFAYTLLRNDGLFIALRCCTIIYFAMGETVVGCYNFHSTSFY